MIVQIHIRNFKSCKNVALSDLGQIVALIGRNGAGKTNVLRSFYWMARTATTAAPDATPFVSTYARGRLVGCFGSDEGAPNERIARAFLRAIADARQQALSSSERAEVVAQVQSTVGIRQEAIQTRCPRQQELDHRVAGAQLRQPGQFGPGIPLDIAKAHQHGM